MESWFFCNIQIEPKIGYTIYAWKSNSALRRLSLQRDSFLILRFFLEYPARIPVELRYPVWTGAFVFVGSHFSSPIFRILSLVPYTIGGKLYENFDYHASYCVGSVLNQKGIVGEVLAQASPDDIRGKDVYGILPLHLAALANSITTVTLNLPLEMCGKELSLSDVEKYSNAICKKEQN